MVNCSSFGHSSISHEDTGLTFICEEHIMDEKRSFLLVDSKVLPEVFLKVNAAKDFLKSGKAQNATEASKMAGISRSAFYKYKDCIYNYNDKSGEKIIIINAVLKDIPGVLSKMCETIYLSGANILTLNQNIPVNNLAAVSVSVKFNDSDYNYDRLISTLKNLNGIESTEYILEYQ